MIHGGINMFTLSIAGGWLPGNYYERYAAAKKYGFKALEMLGWTDLDLDRARNAIDESGVALSAILTQSTDPEIQKKLDNSHGIVWEDLYDDYVKAMTETINAAVKLNCRQVVAVSGNERSDVERYTQHLNIVKALSRVAPIAEDAGVTIVLEPLNILVDHMGYYLVTSKEGFDVIREVGSPNVKLLFDVYHQQISEGNVINNIKNNIDLIGHIHLGDVPGRREPGTGEINYRNVFKAICEAGYTKYAALECGLTTDLDTGVKNMRALTDGYAD